MITSIGVGQPYSPNRKQWPTTEQLRFTPSFSDLTRFWPSPTRAEIEQHGSENASFALIDESPHVLVMAYQFGTLEWSDTPFQAHRMAADLRGLPRVDPGCGLALQTVLVDANTGIVKSLRVDVLPLDFTGALFRAVAGQLEAPFDDQEASRILRRLYGSYATPEVMVRKGADHVCIVPSP